MKKSCAGKILLIVIGIVFILFSLFHYYKMNMKVEKYLEAEAKYVRSFVTNQRTYTDSDGRTKNSVTYKLIYEYVVDGKVYEIERTSSFSPEIVISKTVKYNPTNPKEALFIDFPIIQFFVGSLFLIMPVFSISFLAFLGLFFIELGIVGYYYYSSFGSSLSIADVINFSSGQAIAFIIFIILGIGFVIWRLIMKIFSKNKRIIV